MSVTRRHGANQREDSAPRGVNGREIHTYAYRGEQPWTPGTEGEDPLCGDRQGSVAGFNVHQRVRREARLKGIPEPAICQPCRDAWAEYVAEWRLRTGRVKSRRVRLTAAELALLNRVRGGAA